MIEMNVIESGVKEKIKSVFGFWLVYYIIRLVKFGNFILFKDLICCE